MTEEKYVKVIAQNNSSFVVTAEGLDVAFGIASPEAIPKSGIQQSFSITKQAVNSACIGDRRGLQEIVKQVLVLAIAEKMTNDVSVANALLASIGGPECIKMSSLHAFCEHTIS